MIQLIWVIFEIRPSTNLRAGDELACLGGGLEEAGVEAGGVDVGDVHVGAPLHVETSGAVEPEMHSCQS